MKKTLQLSAMAAMLFATATMSCNNASDSKSESGTAATGGSHNLKFNLKPGTAYSYDMDVLQKIEAAGTTSTNNLYSKYTFNVKEATEGNAKMEVVYDLMRMEVKSAGNTMKMSSEDQTPESQAFRDMVNKPFSMIVSPEGKVVSIEGWESIDKTGTMKSEDLKQTMETSLNIFPDKPVKVGDTWKKDMNTTMQMFKMNISSTYTLTEVKDNVATISLNSDISMLQGDAPSNGMDMNMKGTQKGKMEVDINTGMTLSGTITQDIKGEMKAQGQTMPMSITSDIKITGKQK
ncbi:MAG: hypothetical protein BGO31_07725 [Bacteroidetes bacterium 43-16]|nr:MAG: hypothetical protein BGO31_07725 [Bacteroidetes bacterium 43-16]